MSDLASRLTMPKPHDSDAHAYQAACNIYVTQISTDGFAGYPEAVDRAFGGKAKFGVIIKEYKNATMQYDPSEMVGTQRRPINGIGNGEEFSICTSHVERHNLTVRTLLKRFTRLSLGFSKKLENLEAACAMFLCFYNFCWRTRMPGKSGRLRAPAAMEAGIVKNLWSFERLYDEVMAA
jgi:hypothetical protein